MNNQNICRAGTVARRCFLPLRGSNFSADMTKSRFKEIEKDIKAHLSQEQMLAKWGVSQLKEVALWIKRRRGAAKGRLMANSRKSVELKREIAERERLLSERGRARASDLWPICENNRLIPVF